jgi:phage terminase large subunit-like protein
MKTIGPSNVAEPPYYMEFRHKVLTGQIPVSKTIEMEMNRIDARIMDPDIYFDIRPVDAFINFCEGELTKTDGSPVKMLDTFKLWAEQLFGWYYYAPKTVYRTFEDGTSGFVDITVLKRLISKQYLIVARGAAKSMYESFIQAYFLVIDGETTHQITTAPTMKQAEEIMQPIRTAITRSHGPLFKLLTMPTRGFKGYGRSAQKVILTPTKRGIESFLTGSLLEVRPMTIAKLQGLRTKVNTVDEWLSSGDVREDVIGAIEQGASKLDDYIIVAVSSEGTARNGAGDDVKLELMKILTGEYDDPHTSIFYYRLDTVDEVGQPEMWLKAQPNLGVTVSWETYHRDVLRAENNPSTRNDILAKRFGLPMEGYTYFFTYEETLPHPRGKSYKDMECAMGVDLSQGDDFCSFTFLFPIRGGRFGVKSISFISERTFKLLPPAARSKYDEFIEEKSLHVMDGTVLDMDAVFYVVEEEILERGYDVRAVGYDPYNSEGFLKLWKQYFGPYNLEVVRQGARTESVPLGELKALAEDRVLIFDEEVMKYAMGNTMVLEDTNGNRKLYKRRYEHKIDPVSALMDAYVAYSRHPEQFE